MFTTMIKIIDVSNNSILLWIIFKSEKISKNFLAKLQNMKVQTFTFSLITFDSLELHEYAIPTNNSLNQTNLPHFIAFCSKMATNGLKLGIYESQIFIISLYIIVMLQSRFFTSWAGHFTKQAEYELNFFQHS